MGGLPQPLGLLPPRHFAEPQVSHGRIEVDVATERLSGNGAASGPAAASGGVATLAVPVWSPPAPSLEMDAVFAAEFTVLVVNTEAGPTLVGAIELVSPSNKARPAARRAFAMKCLNYLNAGVGLIVVDVVTERRANLHDEMAGLLVGDAPRFPGTPSIYAAAYRPYRRGDADKVGVWPAALTVELAPSRQGCSIKRIASFAASRISGDASFLASSFNFAVASFAAGPIRPSADAAPRRTSRSASASAAARAGTARRAASAPAHPGSTFPRASAARCPT